MYWHEDGAARAFTAADMAATARLVDKLPNVDAVFGLAMEDVPPRSRDVVGLSIMARNTSKHIRVLCFTPDGAEAMLAMRDVVGPHPWFSVGFTAHGPLRWTNLALDIFYRSAGHGLPATINGEPMAGVSGPVTLAGSCAVGTAEILAGIVVNQLLEPGRPLVFNLGLAHTFDMRTSIAVTGGPENHLYAWAAAEMGRFYRIPSASWVSTESVCPDAQAGLEKMAGFLSHLQSGVSSIWSVGQLESELTFSPAQAVIDNEMIGYARRYLRGIDTSDESLALSAIREVGIGRIVPRPRSHDGALPRRAVPARDPASGNGAPTGRRKARPVSTSAPGNAPASSWPSRSTTGSRRSRSASWNAWRRSSSGSTRSKDRLGSARGSKTGTGQPSISSGTRPGNPGPRYRWQPLSPPGHTCHVFCAGSSSGSPCTRFHTAKPGWNLHTPPLLPGFAPRARRLFRDLKPTRASPAPPATGAATAMARRASTGIPSAKNAAIRTGSTVVATPPILHQNAW